MRIPGAPGHPFRLKVDTFYGKPEKGLILGSEEEHSCVVAANVRRSGISDIDGGVLSDLNPVLSIFLQIYHLPSLSRRQQVFLLSIRTKMKRGN